MKVVDVLVEEYRRIDDVVMWSNEQKTAARSVVRGIAVHAGLYRSFVDALEGRENIVHLDVQTPFFFDERRRLSG